MTKKDQFTVVTKEDVIVKKSGDFRTKNRRYAVVDTLRHREVSSHLDISEAFFKAKSFNYKMGVK